MKKLPVGKVKDTACLDYILDMVRLGDAQVQIEELIEEYGEDAYFDIMLGDDGEFNLNYIRDETKTERERRLRLQKQNREARKRLDKQKEEREREEYERLKKKFEKESNS